MEKPQHRNGSKIDFEEFQFFSLKIPQKFTIVEGFPKFFVSVSQYFKLKGFLLFYVGFLIILGMFPHIFDPILLFFKNLKKSQFVDQFP